MYFGSTDARGMLHLLWELIANALDEHLAGHCRRVQVTIHPDASVTVKDDGRGIPLEPRHEGVTFAERAMTRRHDTPTLDGHAPHAHVGGHGVGLMPVNAVCDSLRLEVRRDGAIWEQSYARGAAVTALTCCGATADSGTTIRYHADPEIFGDTELPYDAVRDRLDQLAMLSSGITFELRDERRRSATLAHPRGLIDLLRSGVQGLRPETISVRWHDERLAVEAVAGWAMRGWGGHIVSFANMQPTPEDGTHVDGLCRGLAMALRSVAPAVTLARARRVVTNDLRAVVHVRGAVLFAGPTRGRVGDRDVGRAVAKAVRLAAAAAFTSTPALAEALLAPRD